MLKDVTLLVTVTVEGTADHAQDVRLAKVLAKCMPTTAFSVYGIETSEDEDTSAEEIYEALRTF